jgi:hypothetical protein
LVARYFSKTFNKLAERIFCKEEVKDQEILVPDFRPLHDNGLTSIPQNF